MKKITSYQSIVQHVELKIKIIYFKFQRKHNQRMLLLPVLLLNNKTYTAPTLSNLLLAQDR